jgi:hypothetical protein
MAGDVTWTVPALTGNFVGVLLMLLIQNATGLS